MSQAQGPKDKPPEPRKKSPPAKKKAPKRGVPKKWKGGDRGWETLPPRAPPQRPKPDTEGGSSG